MHCPEKVVNVETQLLQDVAYQYELKSIHSTNREPLCFILLGNESDDNIVTLSKAIHLRLTDNFDIDEEKMLRSIELIRVTNKSLVPLGFMVLNSRLYEYDKIISKIVKIIGSINLLFEYEPNLTNNQNGKVIPEEDLLLNCCMIENSGTQLTRIGFIIKDFPISIPVEDTPVAQRASNDSFITRKLAFTWKSYRIERSRSGFRRRKGRRANKNVN